MASAEDNLSLNFYYYGSLITTSLGIYTIIGTFQDEPYFTSIMTDTSIVAVGYKV